MDTTMFHFKSYQEVDEWFILCNLSLCYEKLQSSLFNPSTEIAIKIKKFYKMGVTTEACSHDIANASKACFYWFSVYQDGIIIMTRL